ncbi:MAG: hypothetical protein AVDCRST_MAG86-172 [uncultured Truepera sp.]|uniref:Uncharacterized protein n=1 Tax=uncultured Truepera sp. TaxID=543023 RepID=A0A6J4ULW2_9DEIN|nr:MAG: hypothetical protein AVDCRST_MAG86-172 [uncultured Truepera sp.]
MANALYKTTVHELEELLSPRLVSQALHEGLSAVGKTADTVSSKDAEAILRSRVLPRLTSSLGEAQAQEILQGLLERLSQVPDNPHTPPLSLGAQAQAVRLLRDSLKPFNIYFEWSETQKLRAQLLLIEAEHAAGRDAGELIAAAQVQLGVLHQKLSDQLSVQARELTVLEAALSESSSLKTPKIRRLGGLLELIRGAQEAQQRAPAEVERAHKLAADLRAEKSRLLGEEERELRVLAEEFKTLLDHEPALAERLVAQGQLVEAQTLLGEALPAFRAELRGAQDGLRDALQAEFGALLDEAQGPELRQVLTLALKVLETTLTPAADVQRVRDLHAGGVGSAELADFHRLEAEAERYRDLPSPLGQELTAFLETARESLEHSLRLPELTEGWTLLERAQAEAKGSAQRFTDRVAAAQSAAAPLAALNSEEALTLRWRLRELSAQQGSVHRVSPKRLAELEVGLQEAEALIGGLQDESSVTRAVATELLQSGALDDVLDLSAFPRASSSALQDWLGDQATYEGVAGIALFADADTLVAGELPTDVETLRRTVRLAKRRADTLGLGIGQGAATSLTVETPEHTLVAMWLARARSLVLVTRAPTWGSSARQRLEDALPELAALLT